MIRLSGLTLGKDIQIEFSGLRPGEKLYEELLNNTENTLPTHHPKIMIARVDIQRHQEINRSLKELESLLINGSDHQMVARIKQIVPENLSQNYQFESLDKPKTASLK
jgi:FlaA1/EpsC-like NDP-sugar epimerase